MKPKILIQYQTNYNGVSVESDHPFDEDIVEQFINDVSEKMVGECDEDGEWDGDEDEAIEMITKSINEHFGDVEVVVTFDNVSS